MTERKKPKLIEVNVNLNEAVYNFFKERSEQTGIPMKNLYFLALETYVEQKVIMPHLPDLMKKMSEEGKV
jgi:hypothetical protein